MKDIFFTLDIGSRLRGYLDNRSFTQLAVVVDENTRKYCLPIIDVKADIIIETRSGEEHKTLKTCEYIWEELTAARFDRKGLVINLGGGVIGDMGGFCAATYKRGLTFINIPTTLLAQVDASVGGKLGVDFNGFKNHIGLFCHPDAVLIDTVFLKSLPRAEVRSGFAEIIKHHLIADKAGWEKLASRNWKALDADWGDLVAHSVDIKRSIVKNDPKEKGLRKLLNFGHTVGHAVESYHLSADDKMLHGEAIAVGMICESYLSYLRGLIDESTHDKITRFILSVFGKRKVGDADAIAAWARQDKKNEGDKVLCVLLEAAGKASWDHLITTDEIRESLSYYSTLQGG